MDSINGVRKGFRVSAAGVAKALLFLADGDQGHVVLFSQQKSVAYHPGDRVAVVSARRNHVYEVEMEVDSVSQRSVFAWQAQP